MTVVSKRGKEATVTLLTAGDFVGEEAVAGGNRVRMATASAVSACVAMRIDHLEMARVLHEEHSFSDYF